MSLICSRPLSLVRLRTLAVHLDSLHMYWLIRRISQPPLGACCIRSASYFGHLPPAASIGSAFGTPNPTVDNKITRSIRFMTLQSKKVSHKRPPGEIWRGRAMKRGGTFYDTPPPPYISISRLTFLCIPVTFSLIISSIARSLARI